MEQVEIPGGTAVLLNKSSELTARRRRPIEIVSAQIGRKTEAMARAARLTLNGCVVVDQSEARHPETGELLFDGDLEVTEHELELVMRLNDVICLGLLVSWTLDLPIPRTEAEFLDLPVDVYDGLRVHSARINAALQDEGDPFSVDQVEDPASPTGG